ncbi:tryptophan--tRNA ligase [Paremcibacter congregatus]|uniref:Tryptophan--tRNA ligase n=1 Tax=Paremcibacter congregatus TaxID=2043170 RepID=A0A2G4YUJ2_9PROT|nr:tryptophan--tRNA ligase [Paremcibacter congregatus]PHZ86001.1 tryptophan--tRNA ligase [Paremcibacter congregatus]QDE26966.1 tryptophan--tRNA ligase [Paremcibacter congregatus]|tara:strand:+ start:15864 stop:16874 length:1011 start_codon:yes stop_codon:yes gene_type:complete
MTEFKQRIFSGVQPSGNLTLGNYLGAIRNWVGLQKNYESIFCVVDLHAITVWQDPEQLRKATREVAAGMIASGVDPKECIIFNQSQVPAHAELAWIFNCVARLGWLNRMTQFKEKAGKNRERASSGLYVYPNLMAADIMIYKATHVPVGEDQKQHLELARDIAQKFNNDYGVDFFPMVEPLILGEAKRVMSLRDGNSKMSKSDPSDNSRINMTDDRDTIAKKIRKAKTDSEPMAETPDGLEGRAEAKNLISIFAALSDRSVADICTEYGGQGFAQFKSDLADLSVSVLGPITEEMKRLCDEKTYIDQVLKEGSEKARKISDPILKDVHKIVGFLQS